MRWPALLCLLSSLCLADAAAADDDDEPDAGEPRPIRVDAHLDGVVARLTARFVLPVQAGYTRNDLELALPHHAIVTGATATVGGVAHPLALAAVDAAEAAWTTVTTAAPAHDRAWAIKLTSRASELLAFDAAAPRAGKVVLDLELEAPACFAHDRRYVELPGPWQAALAPGLRPRALPADLATTCGDSDAWLSIDSPELASRPFGEQRIGGVAGRLALGDQHLARVELDLAGELSRVPAELSTVLLVDASRSLEPDEVEAQRAIVAAYLRAAPQGRVQVIAYARTAQALLPGWLVASQAAPRIDRAIRALAPRNGSNVDAGVAEAARWLARTGGARRVVLFSDERLAQRLVDSVATLGRGLPDDTIVQVVALAAGEGPLVRDDSAVLAPVAAATTGFAVSGMVAKGGRVDATMLVRPIALDHLKLTTPGWRTMSAPASSCPDDGSLLEGGSCRWWGQGTAVSDPITVEGVEWNRPFVRMLRPDPGQARALARFLAATRELDEALQHEADRVALALDPVWSLFGTWGGKAGYADDDLGFGRSGSGSGCGCVGSPDVGIGRVGTIAGRLDLQDQLAAGVAACHPGTTRIELTLETTLSEIVDVEATVVPASPELHDCVVEAAWNTMLTMPDVRPHAVTKVAF